MATATKTLTITRPGSERRGKWYAMPTLNNPKYNLSDIIDFETAGERGRKTGQALAASAACIKIIAQDTSVLDIVIEKKVAPKRYEVDETHYLNNFFQSPSGQYSLTNIRQAITGNAAKHGDGIGIIRRHKRTGRIEEIEIRIDSDINIYKTTDRKKIWYQTSDRYYRHEMLRPEEVLHVKAFTLDGITGISPLSMAAMSAEMGVNAQTYVSDNYANGGFGGGYIISEDEMDAPSRLQFAKQVRMAAAMGLYPVLDRGMTITPNQISPKDIEYIMTMQDVKQDMSAVYRVPYHMIANTKVPGSNIEQQNRAYVQYCLLPWIREWEDEMERKFLLPSERLTHRIKLDVNTLMRGDTATMGEYYSKMLAMQVYVPNEVRRKLGLPDREGGDKPVDHQKSAGAQEAPGGPSVHTITKTPHEEEE